MQTKFIGAVEEIEGIHGQFYIAGAFVLLRRKRWVSFVFD